MVKDMKTVGIITTFRQPNFGSVLQAYALQRVINSLGYDSELIDYIYPNNYHFERGLKWGKKYKKTSIQKLKYIIRLFLEYLGFLPFPKMKLLNDFISKEMKCSKVYKSYDDLHQNPPIYDIYVSGSDQIWNPNTMFGDMSYMFDFAPIGSKIISYSSSFSCNEIPDEYKQKYIKYLKRYSALSVRERNGIDLIDTLIGRKDAKLVADPTLLIGRRHWEELSNKSRLLNLPSKYILCYKLAYSYNPEKKMCELLRFVQDKYKLPILSLTNINWYDGNAIYLSDRKYNVGIYEFLNLIKKAEIVVTSSFHGTAYALNFGRPFLALTNGESKSDDRISTLLNSLNMSQQLVTTKSKLSVNTNPYYDARKEQFKLASLRKRSMEFLSNSLNN